MRGFPLVGLLLFLPASVLTLEVLEPPLLDNRLLAVLLLALPSLLMLGKIPPKPINSINVMPARPIRHPPTIYNGAGPLPAHIGESVALVVSRVHLIIE